MGDDGTERRGGRRYKARVRVRFRSVEELVTAYTIDLSRGGLYVASERQLPVGSWVKLSLELPDGGEPAVIAARVAYGLDAEQAAKQGREAGMGMQLDADTSALESRIATLLDAGLADDAAPAESFTVVVVDPDPNNRGRIAAALQAAGHTVYKTKHGLEALGKVLESRPDVVLSEMQLPVMDGWQLLRQLRAREATESLAFVFLTVSESEEERARGFELGVDDFIRKPVVASELSARLGRAIARSRRESRPIDLDGMTGMLDQVSVISVLAFAEAERRSGMLVLTDTSRSVQATVELEMGSVTEVELPDADAPAALMERLLRLLEWSEGRFVFRPHETPAQGAADRVSVQAALMEHARRSDERSR